MSVPKLEKEIGIEAYATDNPGIGGIIRRHVGDFTVEEVLVDYSKAEAEPSDRVVQSGVLGSSSVRDRYLLCVLVKRNWDVFSAVKTVADQLGIDISKVQFAGLKDAKAITAQHITIEGLTIEEAQRIHIKDIDIRPIGYFHSKLSSYYLFGNAFRVTISEINHSESTIRRHVTQTIAELRSIGGVPNFFGHQRFGTTRPVTHLVGKAITKRNLARAALIFLSKPSPYEHPASRRARESLRATRDFGSALRDFPKQLRYEHLMLGHLVRKPDDYVGAFRRLPIKLRQLFLQAYQSYLFNRFLSQRMENRVPLDRAELGDEVVSQERSGLPFVAMHKTANSENLVEINRVIQEGKMQLALPLVGYRQGQLTGIQGEIEKRVMEEEGVIPDDFRIDVMPEISLRSKLRSAISPIRDFGLCEVTRDGSDVLKHQAKTSFTLLRSCYATIVLREIMKPRSMVKAGF